MIGSIAYIEHIAEGDHANVAMVVVLPVPPPPMMLPGNRDGMQMTSVAMSRGCNSSRAVEKGYARMHQDHPVRDRHPFIHRIGVSWLLLCTNVR
jgi:hypothetical protein